MKTNNNTVVRTQLWPLVGPTLAFCILLIILLRQVPTPIALPLTAFGGLLASHVWKWKGVAIASVCLAAVLAYQLNLQPSHLWSWTIVLALCIASTFVVTVLCSEESSLTWDQMNKDAEDNRQAMCHLSEKLQMGSKKLLSEQKELCEHNEQLKRELAARDEKCLSQERLIKLARDEISSVYAQKDKISHELIQLRQQGAALAAANEELIGKTNVAALQQTTEKFQVLQDALKKTERALENEQNRCRELIMLNEKLPALQDSLRKSENAFQTEQNRSKELMLQLGKMESLQHALNTAEHALQAEKHRCQELVHQLGKMEPLQHALNTAEHALQAEKHRCQELVHQLGKIDSLQDALNNAEDALQAEKHRCQELVHQLEPLQDALNNAEDALQAAKQRNQQLNGQIDAMQNQLASAALELKTYLEDASINMATQKALHEDLHRQIQEASDRAHHLRSALQASQTNEQQANQRAAILIAEISALKQENEELKSLQQELKDTIKPGIDDRELRRTEGLYQQLRRQFAEKSEVLSATRRELFATQEKLLALQKDQEEARINDESETIQSLKRLLAEAENELACTEQVHALEIDRLHEVVESLIMPVSLSSRG